MKRLNIFIHSLVNLGDVLLSTSAVALLKQKYPEARITMMVRPFARQLVENNSLIDQVLIFDYKAKGKSFRSMVDIVKQIKTKKFDMSISFDRKLRPALLCFLAGIPVRVGPDRLFDDKPSRVSWLYTHTIRMPDDFFYTHQAQLFQEIIRSYFQVEGTASPQIGKVEPLHYEKADCLLQNMHREKKIALGIRGTYYSKNWPQHKFAELIARLKQTVDADFYIVGASGDFDYGQELVEISEVPVQNFCGKTDLLELAAVMEKSDLLITIDTGGMHIAATTKVPIVGIYRCVSQYRWRALTESFQAVASFREDCPKQMKNPECCPGHYCVKDIEVETVYKAALSFLNGKTSENENEAGKV